MRDPRASRIRLDLIPRAVVEGPDEAALDRHHPSQPPRTGAAQEVQQHGLCLIVEVVADRDPRGPLLVGHLFEKAVAHDPGRVLARSPPQRLPCPGIRALDRRRDPERLAVAPHELGRLRRLRPPQAVVKMRRVQLRPIQRTQAHQEVQQHHRIDAAGDRDDDPVPSGQHPVPLDRLSHHAQEPVTHRREPANPPVTPVAGAARCRYSTEPPERCQQELPVERGPRLAPDARPQAPGRAIGRRQAAQRRCRHAARSPRRRHHGRQTRRVSGEERETVPRGLAT